MRVGKINGVTYSTVDSVSGSAPIDLLVIDNQVVLQGYTRIIDTSLGDATPTYNSGVNGTPSGLNAVVTWGDGSFERVTSTGDLPLEHTYSSGGTYEVCLRGRYTLTGLTTDSRRKVTDITRWTPGPLSGNLGCSGFDNITTLTATDEPDQTGFGNFFFSCDNFVGGISHWTIDATSITGMFHSCRNANPSGLGNWDVSGITNFGVTFFVNESFNDDISSWDVSSMTNATRMFQGCFVFNQDLSSWDVGNLVNASFMFLQCRAFTSDLSGWDTSSIEDMSSMFSGCTVWTSDVSSWDVSSVISMQGAFAGCDAFNSAMNAWDVSKVETMQSMFQNCDIFNQNLNSWNTSAVENMISMFNTAGVFDGDCSSWNTSSVTRMDNMFRNTPFNQDISGWNTGLVTSFSGMFFDNTAFDQDLGSWNIGSLTNASFMFSNSVPLSTANYDSILDSTTGWASQATIQNNVTFSAGNAQYTSGGNAEAGRNLLTGTYGWTITDGGPV